jgi:hypothetical protein
MRGINLAKLELVLFMLREKGLLHKGSDTEKSFFLLQFSLINELLDTIKEIAVIHRRLIIGHQEVPNVFPVSALVTVVALCCLRDQQ